MEELDYSSYSTMPQFDAGQSARVRRIKKFLSNRHSASSKARMQDKLSSLYAQRKQARSTYGSPLYGEGSFSQQQIDSMIAPGLRMKYGNEINMSPDRQKQIGAYYDEFKNQLTGIQTQQNEFAAKQQQAMAAAINTAQTNDQKGNSDLLAQMQKDAASRGATVDASKFTQANAASANRAGLGNIQAAQASAESTARNDYYNRQQPIMLHHRQAAMDKERNYTSKLRSDAADYATQMRNEMDSLGYDRGMSTKQLKEQMRQARIAEQLASKQFAFEQSKFAADEIYRNRVLASEMAQAQADAREASKPKLNEKALQSYKYWRYRANAALGKNDERLQRGSGSKYIADLVGGKNQVPPDLARAITMRTMYGGVDRKTQKAIYKAYGFKIRLSRTEKKRK